MVQIEASTMHTTISQAETSQPSRLAAADNSSSCGNTSPEDGHQSPSSQSQLQSFSTSTAPSNSRATLSDHGDGGSRDNWKSKVQSVQHLTGDSTNEEMKQTSQGEGQSSISTSHTTDNVHDVQSPSAAVTNHQHQHHHTATAAAAAVGDHIFYNNSQQQQQQGHHTASISTTTTPTATTINTTTPTATTAAAANTTVSTSSISSTSSTTPIPVFSPARSTAPSSSPSSYTTAVSPSIPTPPPAPAAIVSLSSSSGKRCYNCHASKAPLWARQVVVRGAAPVTLCNACNIHFRRYKRMRPAGPGGTLKTSVTATSAEAQLLLEPHEILLMIKFSGGGGFSSSDDDGEEYYSSQDEDGYSDSDNDGGEVWRGRQGVQMAHVSTAASGASVQGEGKGDEEEEEREVCSNCSMEDAKRYRNVTVRPGIVERMCNSCATFFWLNGTLQPVQSVQQPQQQQQQQQAKPQQRKRKKRQQQQQQQKPQKARKVLSPARLRAAASGAADYDDVGEGGVQRAFHCFNCQTEDPGRWRFVTLKETNKVARMCNQCARYYWKNSGKMRPNVVAKRYKGWSRQSSPAPHTTEDEDMEVLQQGQNQTQEPSQEQEQEDEQSQVSEQESHQDDDSVSSGYDDDDDDGSDDNGDEEEYNGAHGGQNRVGLTEDDLYHNSEDEDGDYDGYNDFESNDAMKDANASSRTEQKSPSKRPPDAFQLFQREVSKEQTLEWAKRFDVPVSEIPNGSQWTGLRSRIWKVMTDEQKQPFYDKTRPAIEQWKRDHNKYDNDKKKKKKKRKAKSDSPDTRMAINKKLKLSVGGLKHQSEDSTSTSTSTTTWSSHRAEARDFLPETGDSPSVSSFVFPKRPLEAFQLFQKEVPKEKVLDLVREYDVDHGSIDLSNVGSGAKWTKLRSLVWKSLPEHLKAPFVERARMLHAKHKEELMMVAQQQQQQVDDIQPSPPPQHDAIVPPQRVPAPAMTTNSPPSQL